MIDALPELPKFDPFYWTNSVSVFGCCLGTYPWVLATTCFDNCCAKDDNCLGNGATSTRNACFVYCFGFIGVAVLMFFYVLGEATGCVLSYILELVVRSALSRSARPKRSPRRRSSRLLKPNCARPKQWRHQPLRTALGPMKNSASYRCRRSKSGRPIRTARSAFRFVRPKRRRGVTFQRSRAP